MKLLFSLLLSLVVPNYLTAEDILALPDLGSMDKYHNTGYAACWGYTAPDGREYALLGVRNGTSIVDITNAPTLNEVAFIPARMSSVWTELKTYQQYAYIVKDSATAWIQIVDLSKLPISASVVNTVTTAAAKNHTITIDKDRALMFTSGGNNNSVTIYSLNDPIHPEKLAEFGGSTYVHDTHVVGNRAYLSEIMSGSFSIWDTSNPRNPVLISRLHDEDAPGISFHNSATTEDGKYLLTTEESNGRPVRIWDIRDELNPKPVSSYIGPGNIPHNVHVKGNFAHIAHYGGGYRVVDISNPLQPREVAFYNNRPENPRGMVNIWEVYPYFPSGKVIMSSIENGLFVTRFDR